MDRRGAGLDSGRENPNKLPTGRETQTRFLWAGRTQKSLCGRAEPLQIKAFLKFPFFKVLNFKSSTSEDKMLRDF
jgi:hypothetical protein